MGVHIEVMWESSSPWANRRTTSLPKACVRPWWLSHRMIVLPQLRYSEASILEAVKQ